MKKIKVYGTGRWIENSVNSPFEEADVIIMPGGGDWNPALYGHRPVATKYWNEIQDDTQMNLINRAIKAKKLIVGICRGGQGLTIKAGGYLIQDVHHPSEHPVKTIDGMEYSMNSCHHQMFYPYELPKEHYEVLAWTEQLSPYHKVDTNTEFQFPEFSLDENGKFKEPEVVWYPEINGLAIQGHPEWSPGKQALNYLNTLIKEKLEIMSVSEEGKHLYEIDDEVRIINDAPLSGNTIAPPVIIGEKYKVKNIVLDKDLNQHLDLGLASMYNYITSWETEEQLPEGDTVHWVHPSRVELVK